MFDLKKYSYDLPEELVSAEPREPRDSAKLLVYNSQTDEVAFDIFRNISKYIPESSLLVLNNTKVLPARISVMRPTGSLVEVLFLVNELCPGDEVVEGMVNKKVLVGEKVRLESGKEFEVVGHKEHIFTFKPLFPMIDLKKELFDFGRTPIPKYLGETSLNENALRDRYQTIFAKDPASVAAPTASLHFTEEVFAELAKKQVKSAEVTLHVGMGTFAPLTKKEFESGKLHEEYFEITSESVEKIKETKREGKPVLAVGTTAVRTIESASDHILSGSGDIAGATNIFIYPPFKFAVTDALITNFHLPQSSLMCLVDAFLQYKGAKRGIVELYEMAIEKEFHFYSFGDSMLII
jgi:S-adenosylmethionine:tRNA ribosyltransferase-isomerase